MKKKILISVFSLLIVTTVVFFVVGAIESYNYDMNPANGVDVLEGFGAAMLLTAGGFIVIYELDLFYTAYYFLVKPKIVAKSLLHVASNLTLLSIVFTDAIARFLCMFVSEIFGEEVIVLIALFLIYLILRVVCAVISSEKT